MSRSLRKSCHACTKSKRACHPQLPKCDRCVKKWVDCVYDLEPATDYTKPTVALDELNTSLRNGRSRNEDQMSNGHDPAASVNADLRDHMLLSPDPPANPALTVPIIYDSVSATREAALSAANTPSFDASHSPELLMAAEAEDIIFLRSIFRLVPPAVRARGSSPFVYGHLYSLVLRDTNDADHGAVCNAEIVKTILEVHMLMASIITLLLDAWCAAKLKEQPKYLEKLTSQMTTLLSLTNSIWSSVSVTLPAWYSRFTAWTIAESARRALVGALMIRGLFWFLRDGYVVYDLYAESLPFDGRSGLWECGKEQEWKAEVKGMVVGEQAGLVSLQEWVERVSRIEGVEKSLPERHFVEFQRLIWGCYHGRKAIEELGGASGR